MQKWLNGGIFFWGFLMMVAVYFTGCAGTAPTDTRQMEKSKAPLSGVGVSDETGKPVNDSQTDIAATQSFDNATKKSDDNTNTLS